MMLRVSTARALLCLLATSPGGAARNSNDSDQWWRQPFGMFQTNLREIDADMNVTEVADSIVRHGAKAWLMSVGGILANYPTELDFQIENPMSAARESGDLIQDTVDAANERGLRLLARMDFSKVQLPVAEAHPEWLYISPNGTWQNHTNNLVSVCPSADWYQERVFDILDEVTDRYPLDGFFINWAGFNERDYFRVYHGVCHCESCQARWKSYTGTDEELPEGDWSENYDDWKVFSDGIIDEWTGRVRDFIAEKLPNAGLILGDSADIMFHEANNAVGRDIWHHDTSQTVSMFKSYRPHVPVLVNSASFLDHGYRMAPEHTQRFAQFHLQAISRGANPSTYIIGILGKIPWPGMELASDVMTFHETWKNVYTNMQPASKTAIVLPRSSAMNETEYEMALAEYKGIYSALQQMHVPFDVIGQQYIEDISENDGLSRYEVIFLPSLGKISSEDADAIDEWVASSGGTVIVTGAAGVDDGGDIQLSSLPANSREELFTEDEDMWSLYFAPEQNRTEEHYYEGPVVPVLGSYAQYSWKAGSEGRFKKLDFAPFAPPEYIYGNTQVDERGLGFASHENGTGVLVPFAVGWGYRETGLGVFFDFIKTIVDEFGADENISFNLSSQVEVTVNANRDQVVVHLINMSGARYQNFGDYLPIPAGTMKIEGDIAGVSARALRANDTLKIDGDGTIQLPGLDLFEVVVIEGL